MFNVYFESSHPHERNRTILSMQYAMNVCMRTQNTLYNHNHSIYCRNEREISNEDFLLITNQLDPFTIIIDVNRPYEASIENNFLQLLQRLQPGGLLIVENIDYIYKKFENGMNDDIIESNKRIRNERLIFFKNMVDLVNSYYFMEHGSYKSLTEYERYCASWIEQISFNAGVVIVHKKIQPDTLYH